MSRLEDSRAPPGRLAAWRNERPLARRGRHDLHVTVVLCWLESVRDVTQGGVRPTPGALSAQARPQAGDQNLEAMSLRRAHSSQRHDLRHDAEDRAAIGDDYLRGDLASANAPSEQGGRLPSPTASSISVTQTGVPRHSIGSPSIMRKCTNHSVSCGPSTVRADEVRAGLIPHWRRSTRPWERSYDEPTV